MKLVYTEQALVSLEETLEFYATKVSFEKLTQIKDRILDKADTLLKHPLAGRKEPFLEHLGLGHRRIIEGHCKIISKWKVSSFTLPIFLIPDKILIK